MLGHSVVLCIENAPRFGDGVPSLLKFRYKEIQELAVVPNCKALHVFEDEVLRVKVCDKSDKLSNELISWIIEHPLSDERETLARGSATDDIYTAHTIFRAAVLHDGICVETDDRLRQRCGSGEVEMMDCGMNGVQLHGRDDVEASLLEPQRHSACTGKKVYCCWSATHRSSRNYRFSGKASRASSSGIARLPERPNLVELVLSSASGRASCSFRSSAANTLVWISGGNRSDIGGHARNNHAQKRPHGI